MKVSAIIIILSLSTQAHSQIDSVQLPDIILTLDKFEYYENENIIMKIGFNLNKGDSIVYFDPLNIIAEIVCNSSNGITFRPDKYTSTLYRNKESGNLQTIGSLFVQGDSL